MKRNVKLSFLISAVIIVSIIGVGLFGYNKSLLNTKIKHNNISKDIDVDKEKKDVAENTKDEGKSKVISVEEEKQINYSTLIFDIEDYLKDKSGIYGLYFINIKNGQVFGVNENEEFIAASTIKVPINLYLFKGFSEGSIDPYYRLKYEEEDYADGTGNIQGEEFGTDYTLLELSRLSIESSDNIAINMIKRYLGEENIRNFEESIEKHSLNENKNISTPKDMAIYMEEVYKFSNESLYGEKFIEFLSNTEFNNRMPKYMPEDITVAHKIGSYENSFHDVGIVYGKTPFILCVMSKENTEENSEEVIGKITRMIFDFQEN